MIVDIVSQLMFRVLCARENTRRNQLVLEGVEEARPGLAQTESNTTDLEDLVSILYLGSYVQLYAHRSMFESFRLSVMFFRYPRDGRLRTADEDSYRDRRGSQYR